MSAAYPSPGTAFPTVARRPAAASSAETMVLVGLVLQVIGGVVLLGGIAWLFGFSILHPFPYAWAAVTAAAIVGGVVVVFLYCAYTMSYLRIQAGDYQGARAPTLVIGILSLIVGVIPGIFYLVGYGDLGQAIQEQQGYAPMYPPPYGVPPAAVAPTQNPVQVACRGCGRVYALGQFAFCPSCGQKVGA